jgi:pyruvate dehydrogenase E2 component (dihydrolipoamide acetyltransferase)
MAAQIKSITMPKWGIEMTEGTISGWRVKEGDLLERGAEILDVETEKIVNAVEAPASGILRRITAGVGDTRAVGTLIGVIADSEASEAEISRFIDGFVNAAVTFETETGTAAAAPSPASQANMSSVEGGSKGEDEARISPIARRIAERLGVNLALVVGTGRNGRISKEDVEAFASRGGAMPSSAAAPPPPLVEASPAATESVHHRVAMSSRRATIARRLLQSKQTIPHYRLDIDVDFGPMRGFRESRPTSMPVTINDLLLRAAALALVEHPQVNAQVDGEDILQFQDADIAIAVNTDAGLVTPILRRVNLKPLHVIAVESRDLIYRARSGLLKREEIVGGTFSISNLGMHAISRFDAIINPPQVAILAVGAAAARPVVRDGSVTVAKVATLTLSADHRVIDGAVGAAFLSRLRTLLEQPALL